MENTFWIGVSPFFRRHFPTIKFVVDFFFHSFHFVLQSLKIIYLEQQQQRQKKTIKSEFFYDVKSLQVASKLFLVWQINAPRHISLTMPVLIHKHT